ncbi:MAG: MBL fold metallo-hydrolase [Myxococcota bacterium]|jgi:glyoxylase-like metal-dependent hydrolase (beta-lactamase superfamily II)|nr:MBL fold metallo-hydrolase [Myxococcota bacterium]
MRATRPQKLVVLALLAVGCAGGDVDPWAPGELLIEQIGLTGEAIGEAALVVGPDGTTVLIDVGNDAHAGRVLGALERHGDSAAVDWVLLTHYHADHIGGFDKLFEPSAANDGEPTGIRQKVLTRGSSTSMTAAPTARSARPSAAG